jgi:predicted MFS family arabinose efflux permease
MALVASPWHLVILLFAVGWAVAPLQAAVSTISQREVTNEYRGRTGAALNTVLTAANVASMAIAGGVAAAIGVRGVFIMAGGIALAAALVAGMLFARARMDPFVATEGVPTAAV